MSQIFYLVIIFALLTIFNWRQISTVLGQQPPGHSLLNPFDSFGIHDFNLWSVLMMILLAIYSTMAWQNSSAYNSAALTPHEGRMGIVLSRWREMGKIAVVTLLGVCAVTYLHHPDFAAGSAHVRQIVQRIADPQAREQMEAPIALAYLLPVGIKGLLCAVLLMAVFGGDATHLHSWGSILIQDVFLPLRKKPFSPRQHIWVLPLLHRRRGAFRFSLRHAVPANGIHQHVVPGYAGHLHRWCRLGHRRRPLLEKRNRPRRLGRHDHRFIPFPRRIICRQIYGAGFPLNGLQISFFTALVAIVVYILVSLMTCHEDFNMDRMLHRGAYAIKLPVSDEPSVLPKSKPWLGKLIGFDDNFTPADKWIAGGLFGYSMIYLVIFVGGTIWNLIAPWPLSVWSTLLAYCRRGLCAFSSRS